MPFESRFGAAAGAYSNFRPDYSSEIFDHILAAVPPGRRQLAIDLGGIVLMIGIAALLTWYKASNAMPDDAVVAASRNFETRRRNIAEIERHVTVWAQGLGRMWRRSKQSRMKVRWRSQPYPTT